MGFDVRNIAVFIDFDNVARAEDFDPRALVSALKERGRLVAKRAYGDWGRYAKYRKNLLEASFEFIELPSHGAQGKNSADIKLVVDALEMALTHEHIDTYVIVSGDSDFVPLISKLRELNRYVVVVGSRDATSKLLRNYCDELIPYRALTGDDTTESTDDPNIAFGLLKRAVSRIESGGEGARASQVKQMLIQLDSAFNESRYGFRQFRDFLQAAQKRNVVWLSDPKNGDFLVTTSKPRPPKPADKPADKGSEKAPEKQAESAQRGDEERDPIAALLAAIRRSNMQFVGAGLQRRVIEMAHEVFIDEGALPPSEATAIIADELGDYVDAGQLSRTKVAGVLRILLSAGVLVTKREEETTLWDLAEGFGDVDDVCAAHDAVFVRCAKENKIDLDEDDVLDLLMPDE